MKALVIGASGTIGSAVAQTLSLKGYEVIAASRHSTFQVDLSSWESIESLFQKIGNVDLICCCSSSASMGKIGSLSAADLERSITNKLTGPIGLVKIGLPYLNPKGIILLTGGMMAYSPWPGSSAIAMVNAGLEGFARAIAKELEHEQHIAVIHPPFVAETALARGMDPSPWPNALKVAQAYIYAIDNQINGVPVYVEGYGPSTLA